MFTIEGQLEHQQSNHVFTKQFIKRRVTYGFGCCLSQFHILKMMENLSQ